MFTKGNFFFKIPYGNCFQLDITKKKYSLLAGKAVELVFGCGLWKTLEDLKGVYSKIFGYPKVKF